MKKLLLLLVLTSTFLSANKLEFAGTDQSFVSKYIWRGISFNQKPVHQASFDFKYGKFGFNIWLNRNLTEENNDTFIIPTVDVGSAPTVTIPESQLTADTEGSSSEYDFTISYQGNFSKSISYETGLILYQFSELAGGDTDELYFGVSFDKVALTPAITLYYDYLDTHLYVSLDAGYGFEVFGLEASIGFHLGIGSGDYIENYLSNSKAMEGLKAGEGAAPGLTDLGISFSLAKQVTKALNISATISYTSLIGDAATEAKDIDVTPTSTGVILNSLAVSDEDDQNILFSLNLGYSL